MTKGGDAVILRSSFPLSVILRSGATKNLRAGVFGTREKILRFAQNDSGGKLRMTAGEAQNDREERKDSSLRSE